jgi:23S rRNA pseudouridine955/2504/2580 synthase
VVRLCVAPLEGRRDLIDMQPALADKPVMSVSPKPPTSADATGVSTAIVTEDEAGMRVDRWFRRRYPALALSHLAKICRKGEVRVDGKRVETSTRLEAGQKVRVPPLKIEAPAAPAVRRADPKDARALADMTLFEDKDLLVLNKPYGLATQGGSGQTRHIDGMLESLATGDTRPVLVHRLDRDTSGVLLVAKNRRMAAELGEIFRSRQAKKIYWALVEGVPKPAQGRISLYLAKGAGMEKSRGGAKELEKMRVAKHGESDAQHSLTYYAIVDKVAPRCAWLSMKPLTGRTHQLRAHAEAIGHPIFGDPKYGHRAEDEVRRRDPLRAVPEGLDRKLHLLARRLILPHPRGGTLDVTAPLPDHMQKSWELFGFDVKRHDPIEEAPDA